MNPVNQYIRPKLLTLLLGTVTALGGCVPMQTATRPTLDEVRSGNVRDAVEDTRLRPGEIEGEVVEVNRSRRAVYVVAADGRRHGGAVRDHEDDDHQKRQETAHSEFVRSGPIGVTLSHYD